MARKIYTAREKEELLFIIGKYKHIIENKNTNALDLAQKAEAWNAVELEFNSSTEYPRTAKQLLGQYYILKKSARQDLAKDNVDLQQKAENEKNKNIKMDEAKNKMEIEATGEIGVMKEVDLKQKAENEKIINIKMDEAKNKMEIGAMGEISVVNEVDLKQKAENEKNKNIKTDEAKNKMVIGAMGEIGVVKEVNLKQKAENEIMKNIKMDEAKIKMEIGATGEIGAIGEIGVVKKEIDELDVVSVEHQGLSEDPHKEALVSKEPTKLTQNTTKKKQRKLISLIGKRNEILEKYIYLRKLETATIEKKEALVKLRIAQKQETLIDIEIKIKEQQLKKLQNRAI